MSAPWSCSGGVYACGGVLLVSLWCVDVVCWQSGVMLQIVCLWLVILLQVG